MIGKIAKTRPIEKFLANQNVPTVQPSKRLRDDSSVSLRASQRLQDQRVCDATKQRVSLRTQQRVLPPRSCRAQGYSASDDCPTFVPPEVPQGFENLTVDENIDRFLLLCQELALREQPAQPVYSAMLLPPEPDNPLLRPMSKSVLAPVFPSGPLNLNPDGSTINFKKSHGGSNADHWTQEDSEEMERLFTTGTIQPILFRSIPNNKVITYVNPVCVEKTNDDGSVKFCTRLTIGGDRIVYPYDTSVVTAELDALKILVNCMISEDANWSAVDLTDFYLYPHPSHPTRHIRRQRRPVFLRPQDTLWASASRSFEPTTFVQALERKWIPPITAHPLGVSQQRWLHSVHTCRV
jgi:hypothetical protein